MTREEASIIIGNIPINGDGCYSISEYQQAKARAIEALEQKPCEDAISRKAVLNKLNKLIEVERLQGTDEMGYGRERVSAYEFMIHSIESEYLYPSVNPQQPCEDAVSRDCDKCAYYDNGANNEACDECFADEYEHPNFKPKAQPCNDCISRQAVLDINERHHGQMPNHINHEIWNEINDLPSVTPKEKTGRWISLGIQGEIDGQIVRAFTCSKCGAISIFRVSNGNIVNGDLCPNCGAKMQEVENDD